MNLDTLGRKKGKSKIIMLTAYDYQIAKILDEIGIDLILVGDSLNMVVLGNKDTKSATMESMLYHTKAVARGAKNTPVVGDMPIGSDKTVKDALRNAKRFIECGANGVKIEGNKSDIVRALIDEGIPVMGHVGLLPQTADAYRVKGKTQKGAIRIHQDAKALDSLGVFSLVLECIPNKLAKRITETVNTVTIGIGAGKHCDGQVLVINDMLGLDPVFKPKYLKRYADLNETIKEAVGRFIQEVQGEVYPDKKHTYH
ncbi:MAG: 3-methyl-2-oxobutanoate hydroxymethyltransferase [Candidatus Hodarchaeota archaeon]